MIGAAVILGLLIALGVFAFLYLKFVCRDTMITKVIFVVALIMPNANTKRSHPSSTLVRRSRWLATTTNNASATARYATGTPPVSSCSSKRRISPDACSTYSGGHWLLATCRTAKRRLSPNRSWRSPRSRRSQGPVRRKRRTGHRQFRAKPQRRSLDNLLHRNHRRSDGSDAAAPTSKSASGSVKDDCPEWLSWGILASIAASFGLKSIGQFKK